MDILSFFDSGEYIKCIFCGRLVRKSKCAETAGKTGVCKDCSRHLPIVPVGTTFQEHRNYIDYCMSTFFYRTPVREKILNFKFKNCTAYADIFAQYMYVYYSSVTDEADYPDCIVPVPLSKERFKERGYNQAELLSQPLAEMLGIEHNTDSLKRVKNTKKQSELLPRDRGKNIADAFAVESHTIFNKSILLIDDIYTTGSTVKECAKTLTNAGARNVRVFTLARQPGLPKSKEYNDLLGN